MIRRVCRSLCALALTLGAWPIVTEVRSAESDAMVFRSAHHDFRLVPVAEGLEQPWSMAFLPDGDLLVTERPGRLRVIRNGTLLPPVEGVPAVRTQNLGGLLEVRLHPDFVSNRILYLSYAKPLGEDHGATALLRARLEDNRLVDIKEIFLADSRGLGHYSGRIVFDRDGYLFMPAGDRQAPPEGNLEAHPAQDLAHHQGVIIRLHEDGRVPVDNPFVDTPGARPEIWSYGHRNIQGLAIHPDTGELWATEHGPQGGDELNLIVRGANYGWPVVGFGVNYRTGLAIHSGTHHEGMEQPVHLWVPSIATSGLMIYTGERFPGWRGNFFVGGLGGQRLDRLTFQDSRVVNRETVLQGMGRVRDVRQGPDGAIYVAVEDRMKPSTVFRMEPVARASL